MRKGIKHRSLTESDSITSCLRGLLSTENVDFYQSSQYLVFKEELSAENNGDSMSLVEFWIQPACDIESCQEHMC